MANETKNSSDVPTIEASVGNLSDLAVGIMKEVKVGDVGVLLSRTQKGVFAVGNKCTHYGAPLHTGVLSGDRVLCPWHKACFNVTTGDIEDAPALDALPSYKVRVSESGEIFVSAPQTEQCKASRRTPEMARPDQNPRHFVIVGGGAGGLVAAETLRNRGFTGKITLVSKEANLPIDRTKLSKDPANAHKSTLRDRAFFDRHSINLLLGQEATAISTAERTLTISDGSVLRWDNIFVSTGGSPRKLTVPGAHHKNVISVRDLSDVTHLNAEMAAGNVKQVVLVGGGFISLELAASFTKNNVQATVVHSDALPLEKILGPQVAAIIKAQHVEKGVKFFPNARPTAIEGKDKAEAVVISSGERLPADFVIAGIGVTPNTAFLKTDPNIELAADGSVIVDATMASRSGIFAGGDIVTFPNHYTGALGRIEHWNVAQDQARVAARNMAGFHTEYKTVPFFWSMQFSGLRFLGSLAGGVDEVLFRPGHSNDLKTSFVAYYVKNNKVTAVCTMMADPTAVAASELMRIERFPSVEELKAALAQSAQTEQKNKDLDFAQLLRNAAH